MSIPSITPLPDAPTRASPATFSADADAFLSALPPFAAEMNALAEAVNAEVSEGGLEQVVEDAQAAAAAAAASADSAEESAAAVTASGVPQAVKAVEAASKRGQPLRSYTGAADLRPLFVATLPDGTLKLALGFNSATGELEFYAPISGPGVEKAIAAGVAANVPSNSMLRKNSNPDVVRLVAVNGSDVLSIDVATGKLLYKGVPMEAGDGGGNGYLPTPLAAGFKPAPTTINHVQGYGQSNDIARDATPPIHTVPSIRHKTFNVGVTATKPGLAGAGNPGDGLQKALVEATTNPDTGGDCGETKHWAAAAAASRRALRWTTSPPVYFRGSAGHGGYRISSLGTGAAWYANVRWQFGESHTLNPSGWSLPFVEWDHGESDAADGLVKATYKTALANLKTGFAVHVQTDTGYAGPIHWLATLSPYNIKTSSGPVDAMLELAAELNDFHIVAPGYIFPQVNNTHLSGVGQALKGEYYGRAEDALWRGFRPDRVTWLGAYDDGVEIVVTARSPTPLQISATLLGLATDYGIKVVDDTGTLTLSNIRIDARGDLRIGRNRALSTNPKFRYARDFLGAGLNILNGASGNIFDSTEDTAIINGVTRVLAHPAPPVELVINLSE